MSKHIDITALKEQAVGRWDMVFNALVPGFDPYLLEKAGKRHGPCPICHAGTDRFRFFNDGEETGHCICSQCGAMKDGLSLVSAANPGWDFGEVLKQVNAVLNGEDANAQGMSSEELARLREQAEKRKREKAAQQQREDRRYQKRLNEAWKGSIPLDDPRSLPVWRYLRGRGLNPQTLPSTIRFHPGMKSFDQDSGTDEGVWPVMLSMVVDIEGNAVTLHRTYITEDGDKAPVAAVKKLMPYPSYRDISGAAIHLSGTGVCLHVTEGIETGFAVREMMDGEGSFWATINSNLMRSLKVGEPVEQVYAWGDFDRSGDGQQAAPELCEKLREEGLQADSIVPDTVVIPEGEKSYDWLDAYNDNLPKRLKHRVKFVKSRSRQLAA